MIKLDKGDVITAGKDGTPLWWIDDVLCTGDYEAVQLSGSSGAWRVIATNETGDEYALQQLGVGILALTEAGALSKVDITITRNGEQIWPKPEPSIEDELLAVMREGCDRPEPYDFERRAAAAFMSRFTITRKENK